MQTETGQQLVIDIGKAYSGEHGIASLVFAVAGLALACIRQEAVQATGIGSLPGDLQVAILAEVGGKATNRRVAVFAVLLKGCVGLVAIYRRAMRARSRHRAWIVAFLKAPGSAQQAHAQEHKDQRATDSRLKEPSQFL
jgi:hypothetical protein